MTRDPSTPPAGESPDAHLPKWPRPSALTARQALIAWTVVVAVGLAWAVRTTYRRAEARRLAPSPYWIDISCGPTKAGVVNTSVGEQRRCQALVGTTGLHGFIPSADQRAVRFLSRDTSIAMVVDRKTLVVKRPGATSLVATAGKLRATQELRTVAR